MAKRAFTTQPATKVPQNGAAPNGGNNIKTRTKKMVTGGSAAAVMLAQIRNLESTDMYETAEKMRRDYQVQLAELVLKANLRSINVSISLEQEETDPEEIQRAELMQDQLQKLWASTLPRMTGSIGEGRVAFEKVYAYNAASMLTYIRKLEALPYPNTSMELDDEGSFAGLTLTVKKKNTTLEPDKCWWLALDATALEPHGRSRFMGAPHEKWKERQEILALRQTLLKRFALRGGIGHMPERHEDETTGQVIDVWSEFQKHYAELQAGGFILLPPDRDDDGNYVYDFSETKLESYDSTPVQTVVSAQDQEQLVAFGIPPKTIIEGDAVGSFAMVGQQIIVLFSIVEDILDQYCESYQKYVIDKSVGLNWHCGDPKAPRFTIGYQKLTDRPDSLAMEVVKGWLAEPQLSPLLLSGVVDVGQMLEQAGVPVTEDVSDKIDTMFSQLRASLAAAGAPALPSMGDGSPVASGDAGDPAADANGADPGADPAGDGGADLATRQGWQAGQNRPKGKGPLAPFLKR